MIALNETSAAAAEVPFFLPLTTSPIVPGLTGHSFSSGEVTICLPGGSFFSVSTSQIVEKGYGRYCVQLTALQCTVPGLVYVHASVSSAQPYNGNETIGSSGGDLQVSVGGYIPFFLPNATNPVYGSPVTGHSFSTGEVQLCLPGGSYANASTSNIIELGNGAYALLVTAGQAASRGKAFIYTNVSGAQPYEGYVDILTPAGFGFTDAVVVSAVSPTPLTQAGQEGGFPLSYSAAAVTPIVVDVTDGSGSTAIALVSIAALLVGGAVESVYLNGNFQGEYVAGSYQTSISDGLQLNIARASGWPGATLDSAESVGIMVVAVNVSGEVTTATYYYDMPAAQPFFTPFAQVSAPPGQIDHVAAALQLITDQFRSRA